MNPDRLWRRLSQGQLQNIRFGDLERLLHEFGWALDSQEGSHRLYRHPDIAERLNFQPDRNGQAKPYQVREFLRYVKDYALRWEER